jgi:hypothetical protein
LELGDERQMEPHRLSLGCNGASWSQSVLQELKVRGFEENPRGTLRIARVRDAVST